jgi:hypothetical protein
VPAVNAGSDEETLETAAGKADGPQHAHLRAAAMLRGPAAIAFDANTEAALSAIATEMNLGRLDVIRIALREWLALREKDALSD